MRILIIGDGVAGHTAAVEIRERDPDADITIISDEEYPFYDRVGLKKLVEGEVDYDDLIKADKDFYKSKNIDLRLGVRATDVNPEDKVVDTNDGDFSYDKLLIATGGELRKLDLKGSDSKNVYYLWDLEDAKELDHDVEEGQKAVVVGGGFLGLEMACSMRKRGLEVDYLVREDHWGVHCVSPQAASLITSDVEDQGVRFHTNTEVEDIVTENQEVDRVVTNSGEFECDALIICIGLSRNVDFLKGSGIETDSGVLTDEYLETNKEDVYAAGDVAEYYDPLLGHRMMNGSWPSAKRQGDIAGINMVDEKHEFRFVNSHVINHFDLTIMTLGDVWINQEKETYTEVEGNSCIQVVTEDENVVGAVLVNDLSSVSKVKKAVKGCERIEETDILEDVTEK